MASTGLLFNIVSQIKPYFGTQVVVLTAHPDDEVLFFGPTLQHMEKYNTPTLVVCLTAGGWRGSAELKGGTRQDEGQAALRVSELMSLSKQFSAIKTHHLRTPLLDGPYAQWDDDLLQMILYGMNMALGDSISIYTFDAKGVTGHINHCQIGRAVATSRIRAKCYFLLTPHWLAWLIPYIYKADKNQLQIVSTSPCQLKTLFLTTYSSQDVWFRRLFLNFAPLIRSNVFSTNWQ